jgi:DHA1 family bicyclomycin/chloramphenicol resistance-like MFS transporter
MNNSRNDETPAAGHPQENYRALELVAYTLFAIGPMVGNGVLVMLDAMASDFNVDPTDVMLAITAFMIPFAIVQLFSGAISDTKGRVPVLTFGIIVYLIAMLLEIFSTSLPMFILASVISGFGFGFVNPVLVALITDGCAPSSIPKRMGVVGALAAISVGLGPAIAGQLVVFGWQTFYAIFLVLSLLCLALLRLVKRPVNRQSDRPAIGNLISNLSLELKRPVVLLLMLCIFAVGLSYSATIQWTSRGMAGVDEGTIGLLLLLTGIVGFMAGVSMNRIIGLRGIGTVIVLGLISLFTAVVILMLAGNLASPVNLPLVAAALLIAGWAGGTLSPVLMTYSQILSPERRGVLAGALTSSMFIGNALNVPIYSSIFAFGIQWVYTAILVVAVGLSILMVLLYRAAPKPSVD